MFILLAALYSGHTQSAEGANTPADLNILLQKISLAASSAVEWGPESDVVSVILPNEEMTTDVNLRLLAASQSLRSLTLGYRPHTMQPSEQGVAALKGATALRSLTLRCGGELPEGFFRAVASLSQLQTLSIIGASPPKGIGYEVLTNATSLRRLEIHLPSEFHAESAIQLSKLRQVRELYLKSPQIEESDCVSLVVQQSLTNLVVNGKQWSLSLSRRPKQAGESTSP